jgi:hypothetical protein
VSNITKIKSSANRSKCYRSSGISQAVVITEYRVQEWVHTRSRSGSNGSRVVHGQISEAVLVTMDQIGVGQSGTSGWCKWSGSEGSTESSGSAEFKWWIQDIQEVQNIWVKIGANGSSRSSK